MRRGKKCLKFQISTKIVKPTSYVLRVVNTILRYKVDYFIQATYNSKIIEKRDRIMEM